MAKLRRMRKPAAADTGGGGGTGAPVASWMNWFACCVPSEPQTGHATAQGIRLFTGSTANL